MTVWSSGGACLISKVAVFSNLTDLRDHSLNLGADWYFDKSLDFTQLLALMADRDYWLRQGAALRREAHVDS